jgi:hypothetical protein
MPCYNESHGLIFRLEILEIHETPAVTVSSESNIREALDMMKPATTADSSNFHQPKIESFANSTPLQNAPREFMRDELWEVVAPSFAR